jgi:hypothetical protein
VAARIAARQRTQDCGRHRPRIDVSVVPIDATNQAVEQAKQAHAAAVITAYAKRKRAPSKKPAQDSRQGTLFGKK